MAKNKQINNVPNQKGMQVKMKENKLKIITIILLIILITLVSFFGVYTQKRNKMVNSTQDYKYGMDIDSQVV